MRPSSRCFVCLVFAIPIGPLFAQETFRLPNSGVKLPGPQLMYDAAFEVLDFNRDGKPDLFMPSTSMMNFCYLPNVGAKDRPRFGHALNYPLNITETDPQPIEHTEAFAVCDLNGDGLFDMVVFDGEFRYLPNVGTKSGPNHWHLSKKLPHFFPGSEAFVKDNARFSTGPESLHWNKGIFGRQVVTFAMADWDGDGLEDLLVCRFDKEAPGVAAAGGTEQWTGAGRILVSRPNNKPPSPGPSFTAKLDAAPARSLHFYKNAGSRDKAWFDKGVEICTPDGKPIVAPNPVVIDVDGDGILDLASTETQYSCNAFRVDWPTAPTLQWFRRPGKDVAVLEAARPLTDAAGKPIPAGTQARFADMRGVGVKDLLVMNAGHKGSLRWYANRARPGSTKLELAAAEELAGSDFLRVDFMSQPIVVDWFAPGSRDLILHGCNDAHCCWALRRTALYRNVAKAPGEIRYEFVGQVNFQSDPRMVGCELEDRNYDVYGSAMCVWPGPEKRIVMSVAGKLYLFSDLAADGLTFQKRTALELPAERNRRRGWQEIAVKVPEKVRYIRVGNDRNGMGNLRDSMLHIVQFEAWANGKNWATVSKGVKVTDSNKDPSPGYRVQRPALMFRPDNKPSDVEPKFTSFGYYIGPATIELREAVALEKIHFLLSDREDRWYHYRLPYYWQGKHYRAGLEQGEPWYQYTVEVSADGQKWTTVSDTMGAEMMRSNPNLVDWDGDGKVDLVLGVLNGKGIWPNSKEYRLYRNQGSNEQPRFEQYESLCDDSGKPLKLQAYWYLAYGAQCDLAVHDLDGDGKLDIVVEGYNGAEITYYRNVSKQPAGLRFQRVKDLGNPQPIRYGGGYRYFHLGDVDGDGIPDLLNSTSANIAFFKGVKASAPASVEKLAAQTAGKSIEVHFAATKDAARYDLRWSEQPITELEWPHLKGVTGNCDVKDLTRAKVDSIPAGKLVFLAMKVGNEKGAWSELSSNVEVVTGPWQQLVLRNGPSTGDSFPAYEGTQACYVDASKPKEISPRKPSALRVHAKVPNGAQQKLVLIRFTDLPKTGNIEEAVLELTTDPTLQQDAGALQGMSTHAISCSAIRDDWDAGKATYTEAAPGHAWAKDELDAGGVFQSFAPPVLTISPRRTLSWNVTEAVRAAKKAGRTNVSLLIRVDYTGYYIAGQGYVFCGPDFPAIEQRPKLRLTCSR